MTKPTCSECKEVCDWEYDHLVSFDDDPVQVDDFDFYSKCCMADVHVTGDSDTPWEPQYD